MKKKSKKWEKVTVYKGHYDHYFALFPCVIVDLGIFVRFIRFYFFKWFIEFKWVPDINKFTETYQTILIFESERIREDGKENDKTNNT